jgi:ribosomal protein S18 acetylase RimI-like enzyme
MITGKNGDETESFSLRPARKNDAVELAVLMDIASQGLVSGVWRNVAGPEVSLFEIGRARVRESVKLPSHFTNWTVAESVDEICGAYAGYVVPDPYDAGDTIGLSAAYQPVLQLEAMARGCWFLMAIAVYVEFRRKGLGTALLRSAEAEARSCRVSRMALTVSSSNDAARRLYDRSGFAEWSRRKRHDDGLSPGDAAEWILLAKELKP